MDTMFLLQLCYVIINHYLIKSTFITLQSI